jgi:hypothetical protein
VFFSEFGCFPSFRDGCEQEMLKAAISYQLSALSYQLARASLLDHQPRQALPLVPEANCVLEVCNYPANSYQPSAVSCQLSAVSYQPQLSAATRLVAA